VNSKNKEDIGKYKNKGMGKKKIKSWAKVGNNAFRRNDFYLERMNMVVLFNLALFYF